MYLKIKIAKTVKNKFGKNDIMISQIQAVAEDGKHMKFIKLTDQAVESLKDSPILIKHENLDELLK